MGKTYGELLSRTCQKILDMAEPFTRPGGNATYKNLIDLKGGVPVGQWRDSNDGLGGGRYPYDVNTALMPAALRAIAELTRTGAFEKEDGWDDIADKRAQVWETLTLDFFNVELHSNNSSSIPLIQQYLTAYSPISRRMRLSFGSENTNKADRSLVHLERIKSMTICCCRQ